MSVSSWNPVVNRDQAKLSEFDILAASLNALRHGIPLPPRAVAVGGSVRGSRTGSPTASGRSTAFRNRQISSAYLGAKSAAATPRRARSPSESKEHSPQLPFRSRRNSHGEKQIAAASIASSNTHFTYSAPPATVSVVVHAPSTVVTSTPKSSLPRIKTASSRPPTAGSSVITSPVPVRPYRGSLERPLDVEVDPTNHDRMMVTSPRNRIRLAPKPSITASADNTDKPITSSDESSSSSNANGAGSVSNSPTFNARNFKEEQLKKLAEYKQRQKAEADALEREKREWKLAEAKKAALKFKMIKEKEDEQRRLDEAAAKEALNQKLAEEQKIQEIEKQKQISRDKMAWNAAMRKLQEEEEKKLKDQIEHERLEKEKKERHRTSGTILHLVPTFASAVKVKSTAFTEDKTLNATSSIEKITQNAPSTAAPLKIVIRSSAKENNNTSSSTASTSAAASTLVVVEERITSATDTTKPASDPAFEAYLSSERQRLLAKLTAKPGDTNSSSSALTALNRRKHSLYDDDVSETGKPTVLYPDITEDDSESDESDGESSQSDDEENDKRLHQLLIEEEPDFPTPAAPVAPASPTLRENLSARDVVTQSAALRMDSLPVNSSFASATLALSNLLHHQPVAPVSPRASIVGMSSAVSPPPTSSSSSSDRSHRRTNSSVARQYILEMKQKSQQKRATATSNALNLQKQKLEKLQQIVKQKEIKAELAKNKKQEDIITVQQKANQDFVMTQHRQSHAHSHKKLMMQITMAAKKGSIEDLTTIIKKHLRHTTWQPNIAHAAAEELVNKADANGSTALFHAAWWSHSHVIKFLLDQGAHTDHQNFRLNTALHLACDRFIVDTPNGHHQIIQTLLSAGADPTLHNRENKRCFELEALRQSIDVATFIRNHLLLMQQEAITKNIAPSHGRGVRHYLSEIQSWVAVKLNVARTKRIFKLKVMCVLRIIRGSKFAIKQLLESMPPAKLSPSMNSVVAPSSTPKMLILSSATKPSSPSSPKPRSIRIMPHAPLTPHAPASPSPKAESSFRSHRLAHHASSSRADPQHNNHATDAIAKTNQPSPPSFSSSSTSSSPTAVN